MKFVDHIQGKKKIKQHQIFNQVLHFKKKLDKSPRNWKNYRLNSPFRVRLGCCTLAESENMLSAQYLQKIWKQYKHQNHIGLVMKNSFKHSNSMKHVFAIWWNNHNNKNYTTQYVNKSFYCSKFYVFVTKIMEKAYNNFYENIFQWSSERYADFKKTWYKKFQNKQKKLHSINFVYSSAQQIILIWRIKLAKTKV